MKTIVLASACFLFSAGAAQASTCEQSFTKQGNQISGLRFAASVSVPDMDRASAIGQLRGIVAAKGYTIMASEPEAGTMLIEQPATGKARSFPIEILAGHQAGVGTVRMEAKLRATMSVPEAAAKTELCGMLSQLKGGKAGRDLAAKGMNAETAASAPLRMSVLRFSQDMTGEANKNAAAIPLRYKNKSFTLYGPVAYVGGSDGMYWIEYKLLSNVLTDIVPGRASASLAVYCALAPGQSTYALQLKPDKHVELTGTFDRYEQGQSAIWLKDCRPVKK